MRREKIEMHLQRQSHVDAIKYLLDVPIGGISPIHSLTLCVGAVTERAEISEDKNLLFRHNGTVGLIMLIISSVLANHCH